MPCRKGTAEERASAVRRNAASWVRKLAAVIEGRPEAGRHPSSGDLSDEEFVSSLYRRLLGRRPDAGGMATQVEFLSHGGSRAELVLNFVGAPEFLYRTVRDNVRDYIRLLPIIDERPANYGVSETLSGVGKVRVFSVSGEADFDWLEKKIIENDYCERPGVWSFSLDEDKRMMAVVASVFSPGSVLDFGCSNGAVLKSLRDLGIAAEGIEISRLALDMAFPEIRENIHVADILRFEPGYRYDLVLGLDVFEHLNPNRLGRYIERIAGLLNGGGFLYANIPAFGNDPVFGEIFPMDLPGWAGDAEAGRCFRVVPVDDYGYPRNGHIICADTRWWVDRFQGFGFRREFDIEKALHGAFDADLERVAPARRSFYAFSLNASPSRVRAVLDGILVASAPSAG
jgi:SAM-dependent methyltransferase